MDPTMDPNAKPPLGPHMTPSYLAENKGPSIMVTCCTVTALSTLFIFARLFTRQKIMGKLHLDDYLVTLALVSRRATCPLSSDKSLTIIPAIPMDVGCPGHHGG